MATFFKNYPSFLEIRKPELALLMPNASFPGASSCYGLQEFHLTQAIFLGNKLMRASRF